VSEAAHHCGLFPDGAASDDDGPPVDAGGAGGDAPQRASDAAVGRFEDCGLEDCAPDDYCCVPLDGTTPSCGPTCTGFPVECDGPEDCLVATSSVCCFDEYGVYGACLPPDGCSLGPPQFWVVCHGDGDCSSGTCQLHPTLQLHVCR